MKYIIAHRANLFGPNPKTENHPDQIELCISLGLDVEIDVRYQHGAYYLGHDEAQYEVPCDFFATYSDHLWIHCKNLEALSKLKFAFNCFYHDVDDYVLTSRNNIWSYPGKVVDNNCIVVMPERDNVKYNLQDILGICTDYPLDIHRFTKETESLEKIYDRLLASSPHLQINKELSYDNFLNDYKDPRYCYAIFSQPCKWEKTHDYDKLLSLLPIDSGVLYVLDNNDFYSRGSFHFTLMQPIEFKQYSKVIESYPINNLCTAINQFRHALPFKINYRRLSLLKDGLMLLGVPDVDLNGLRNSIRDYCRRAKIDLYEPYLSNMAHSRLFRFSHPITLEDLPKELIEMIGQDRDYGTATFDSFSVGSGTWKLNKNEIIIDKIIK